MSEDNKDRASVAMVLSVLVLIGVIVLCPIVGALVEGISRWEQSFPLK